MYIRQVFIAGMIPYFLLSSALTAETEYRPDTAPAARKLEYKPFPVQDPRTGAPLNSGEKFKLNDGKVVKAGDYYTTVNENEKWLTSRGYTLRDKKTNMGVVADVRSTEPLKAAQMKQIQASLVKSKRNFRSSELQPSSGKRPVLIAGTDSFAAGELIPITVPRPVLIGGGGTVSQIPPCTSATQFDRSASNDLPMGSRSSASLNFSASMRFEANCTRVAGIAEAAADAALINNDLPVFRSRIMGEATTAGTALIDLDVYFAGKKVFDFDRNDGPSVSVSQSFQHNYDRSFRGRASVGPIPVSFTLGGNGNATIAFAVEANLKSAKSQVTPSMRITSYAEGAVDIFIASGGIGAELLLLSLNLPMTCEAHVAIDTFKPTAFGSFDGVAALNALSGRVFLFGELNLIFFRPRFETNLVSFSGFNVNGTLLQKSESLPLL